VSFRVVFRPEAVADLQAAVTWYEARRPGLGADFEAALDADLALLRETPRAFPVVLRDLRKLLLRRFPYAIYFRLEADEVVIRGVLHLRQHPRHWRRRA
jgi:toxin ParE1/3/4